MIYQYLFILVLYVFIHRRNLKVFVDLSCKIYILGVTAKLLLKTDLSFSLWFFPCSLSVVLFLFLALLPLHLSSPQTVTLSWGTPRSSLSIPLSTALMVSVNWLASAAASWCRRAACVTSCMAVRPAAASLHRCRKLWMNGESLRLRSFCTRKVVRLNSWRTLLH